MPPGCGSSLLAAAASKVPPMFQYTSKTKGVERGKSLKTWECDRLFRKEVWYSDPVLPCSTRRSLFVGSEPNIKTISAMPSFVGSLCFFERNFQLPWNSMEFHGIRPHFLRKTTEITTEMDNVVIRELPAIVGILSPYRTPKSVLERRRRRSLLLYWYQ